jgi:pimeloyl-ACP methyl ester carboxylesterase
MGALVAMAYVPGRRDVQTLTLSGPAGLAKAPPTRWLLTNDHVASLVGRRLGRRLLLGHMSHNVRDGASASALADMVNDAFRYEGSMYALFSTLQNLPLHGQSDLFRNTGDLGVPTMLLWGDDDQVTPLSGLATARDLLRPREHHVIRDCGHMAPLERPGEVAELISSFAASSRRVGS